jgi:hypothetical protein
VLKVSLFPIACKKLVDRSADESGYGQAGFPGDFVEFPLDIGSKIGGDSAPKLRFLRQPLFRLPFVHWDLRARESF